MDCRLKKQKDFDLIFKKGRRLYSSRLTLCYISADSLKVGYAVGKKHGGSVKRNRIKRILRESFRSFMPFIRQNFFFVFIPKLKDEYDFNSIKEEMRFLLKKGGFLSETDNAEISER